MEQDPFDEDAFPRLTSSPVIGNSRLRKKSAKKNSGTSKACPEDNEVTSTTSDVETKESRKCSMKVDSSNLSDKGDVSSPTKNGEEATKVEKITEEKNDIKGTVATNNVKEKIVFCVDTFDDPDGSPFIFSNGQKYRTLTILQRVLTMFLKHKNTINHKHEFAIIELDGDSARWRNDFTNDIEKVITSLENMTPNEEEMASFDLTSLFDVIVENVIPFKESEINRNSLSPFVVRVIVLYSRSQCIPQFNSGAESFNLWSESATNCFLDTLYIHEKPADENNCKIIYESLRHLETDSSFSFQVIRSAVDIHNCMAKLLANPLQRGDSSHASFKLKPVGSGRNGSS